jgi:hypothetical protein
MSADQLQEWDDKITALTQRILSFYEPPEFNVIRQLADQSSPDDELKSAPALRRAVTTICDALVLNLRLAEKINAAKALRAKPRLLFQNRHEQEIQAILTQPVVAVDPVELQDPGLFNLAAGKYTLEDVFHLLDSQVNEAAAILCEATRKLRDSQQLLSVVEHEMKQARQSLSQAGLDDAQLYVLQTQLRSSSNQLAQDPLSEPLRLEVRNGVNDLKTLVQEQIEALRRLSELQDEATLLNVELQNQHRQAQQVFADRLARVQVHSGAYPPPAEDDIKNLADRLRPLMATKQQAQEIIPLLQDWLVSAKSALEKAEQSIQKNQGYLDLRLELRGLLGALAAKAAALNKAEDRRISGLLDQVHAQLYQRPSPIELARELLSQVEQALNQVDPTD